MGAGDAEGGKPNVIFVCTQNSARSQMAEGLARQRFGNEVSAHSAGLRRLHVRDMAKRAMEEAGIDISTQWSKALEDIEGVEKDVVVTVCDSANEACPRVTGAKKRIHKGFDDPAKAGGSEEEQLDAFRRVRDQLDRWLRDELMPAVRSGMKDDD